MSFAMWASGALFVVVAGALVLWMVKVERGRLESHVRQCEAAAARMGVSYRYRAPDALLSKVQGFDLTHADGAMLPQRVRDVFSQKNAEDDLYVFLHEFRSSKPEGSGAAQRTTAGCLVSARLRLPRFRLSPERLLEKAAAAFGMRDIDFASHPVFSASYFLNARDDTGIAALFHRGVLDFFERHPGLYVEGSGDTLLVYRPKRTVDVAALPGFFTDVQDVARLFRR